MWQWEYVLMKVKMETKPFTELQLTDACSLLKEAARRCGRALMCHLEHLCRPEFVQTVQVGGKDTNIAQCYR